MFNGKRTKKVRCTTQQSQKFDEGQVDTAPQAARVGCRTEMK